MDAGLWHELLKQGEPGGWILCQGLEKGARSSPCLGKRALEAAGRAVPPVWLLAVAEGGRGWPQQGGQCSCLFCSTALCGRAEFCVVLPGDTWIWPYQIHHKDSLGWCDRVQWAESN